MTCEVLRLSKKILKLFRRDNANKFQRDIIRKIIFEVKNLEDKIFVERVLNVFKNNLFEVQKLFFNLDNYVSKNDFEDLQKKYSNAKNEIDELKSQLQDKENELTAANEKISALSESLKEKNNQLEHYAENYSELETAYNSYKQLPDNTKFALEGIFGEGNSPTGFLSGAIQEKNLNALFDYTATEINDGADQAKIENLCSLFDFSFSAINSGRREKLFERLETYVGADFDGETMRKTSDSAQSGTIKNVLLSGYKYCRTGKIVKPSLVFID